MDNLRSERDKTLVALRDLEMGNDELERNERFVCHPCERSDSSLMK
jgi:hypothetical protein